MDPNGPRSYPDTICLTGLTLTAVVGVLPEERVPNRLGWICRSRWTSQLPV